MLRRVNPRTATPAGGRCHLGAHRFPPLGFGRVASFGRQTQTARSAGGRSGRAGARRKEKAFNKRDTALVIIDPQNDFLSPHGSSWSLVGKSVVQTGIIGNLERLLAAAKRRGFHVMISPHYFYPTDHTWRLAGPLEAFELQTRTFARAGPLTLEKFAGSGADWFPRLRPFIEDGKTVVVSPHKVFGPQTNDLVLQLRKRGISRIVLAGMLANMCVESHLREFLEQGFEVTVVKDAIAGPIHPQWGDGYASAMINFHFLAHSVLSTQQALTLINS